MSKAFKTTKNNPLITIIVAVLNGRETIRQCIETVNNQTYLYKELIIIDGGSTDGTVEILKDNKDKITYWESMLDRGIYHAFNKAIKHARGQWLYFLGGDDRFSDENVLQRIFSRPIKGKLIYGNVLIEGDGPIKRTNMVYDGNFTKYKLCLRNICQQAIFYHKSLFNTLGTFDLKYPVLADYAFNMKAFAAKGTEPHFVDTLIAVFWNEGLSGHHTDIAFENDRHALVKHLYGFPYYLFFISVKYSIRLVVWITDLVGLKTKWQNKK